jgi:HEPN domain-containing protein
MQPLTTEWVQLAEGDITTCQRELRARKLPNYNAACFHAQQCAEKYLKARLQEAGIAFPKTHNLEHLLQIILPLEPTWTTLRSDLIILTSAAIEVRYPGMSADKVDAKEALRISMAVRKCVRLSLALPPE